MCVTQDYKIVSFTCEELRAVQTALAVRTLELAQALNGETDQRYIDMFKADLVELHAASAKVRA